MDERAFVSFVSHVPETPPWEAATGTVAESVTQALRLTAASLPRSTWTS